MKFCFSLNTDIISLIGNSTSKSSRNKRIFNDVDECAIHEPSLIINSYLYLGSAYATHNPVVLERLGITHLLNMSAETPVDKNLNKRFVVKHIMADNTDLYNMRYHFDEAFAFIDEGRKHGNIFVYCARGISRSPTIAIAYLMHRYRMPLTHAYDQVKRRRPQIMPNSNFMRILTEYESELLQSRTPKPAVM